MKTLIVDDNADDRKILRYNLEHNGCQVIEAADGEAALEMARLHKPDLIISDVLMPKMDGFHLLRALRQEPSLQLIPFVFYSATYTGHDEADLSRLLGAQAYMVKPKDPMEFWDELREILDGCSLSGRMVSGAEPVMEDTDALLKYSNIVANKLEEKVRELELALAERRQSEKALREGEERYRFVVDNLKEIVFRTDAEGCWSFLNPAWTEITGFDLKESLGKVFLEFVHPDDRQRNLELFRPLIDRQKDYCRHEVRYLHKDGGFRWIEVWARLTLDEQGNATGTAGTLTDITTRRAAENTLHRLEEERGKVQRLESLGTLAGGIAHDFNNLMHGIFGFISMAKMFLDPSHKSYALLAEAEKALDMSAALSNQLLTFSKGGEPLKKIVSVPQLLENSVRFALSGSQVNCSTDIQEGLLSIEADEGQIRQVIQNIAINAMQAMNGTGRVTVTARNVIAPAEGIPLSLKEGRYVELAISDTGPGISREVLPRIFDPYFTTHEMGSQKGTGLGLSVAYSVVNRHHGAIEVRSESGKGSTFLIYLPAAAAGQDAVAGVAAACCPGHKRVLALEDEAMVANVIKAMIGSMGHDIEIVENGEAAVGLYRSEMEKGRPFDAVLLDLTVKGGMGGERCMEELLKLDPEVRAIVSSGYTDNPVILNYKDYGFSAFLKKPYRFEALKEHLDALICRGRV